MTVEVSALGLAPARPRAPECPYATEGAPCRSALGATHGLVLPQVREGGLLCRLVNGDVVVALKDVAVVGQADIGVGPLERGHTVGRPGGPNPMGTHARSERARLSIPVRRDGAAGAARTSAGVTLCRFSKWRSRKCSALNALPQRRQA